MPEPIATHLRQTLRLALPASAAQLGLVAMGVVDTAMVGRLGAAPLAAVGLGNSLFFAPTVACMGVVMAIDPMVAQAYGAGRRLECGRAYGQVLRLALWLAAPLGLAIAGIGPLLGTIGVTAEVIPHCDIYLRLLAFSAPMMLVFVALRGFLQGLGKTRPALVAVIFGNVVNVVLNWVLIFGHLGAPALGVAGSAIATVVARLAMVLVMVWIVYAGGRHRHYGVPGASLAVDPERMRTAVRLGLPIAGHLLSEVGMFSLVALMMSWLGAQALAAHQIALQLAAVTFMATLGIGIGGGIRVGHAVGARRRPDATRAAWVAVGITAALMSLSATIFATFPRALIRLFTPDPSVIEAGATLLRIAALFQLADGLQTSASGCLRGAGDTSWPMRAHLVGGVVVGLPLAFVLAFAVDVGPTGLWWGLTAGLTTSGAALLWRLRGGRWWPATPVGR